MRIKELSYIKENGAVKLVIETAFSVFSARLTVNGKVYADEFNDEEPYDRQTHVFHIAETELTEKTQLVFSAKRTPVSAIYSKHAFAFGTPEYADGEKLKEEYDHKLQAVSEETENTADGVVYRHILYKDKDGAPVHVFTVTADPEKASLYIGTPEDGTKAKNIKATIPAMIKAAVKNGHDIITGVNADFFDMFGDGHPSGLCVKNGEVIANKDSMRPFVAATKDGRIIITDQKEAPGILPELQQAAAGLQLIVKNGKLNDFAPLEPFSYTRHPRTAAGVTADGRLIITVVDGRIPDYSNGASLVDLAKLMISFGADRALNMDGGGSSAIYTKNGEEHVLRSRPADLVRPTAKLIRKDYNSLLIERKKDK